MNTPRPSRLYYTEKLTKALGGAKIYLKRENLNHIVSHKINNVLGQTLNVYSMKLLGADVIPVRTGTATLVKHGAMLHGTELSQKIQGRGRCGSEGYVLKFPFSAYRKSPHAYTIPKGWCKQ